MLRILPNKHMFTTIIPPRVPRLLEALSLIIVYKSPMPPIHCSHPLFSFPKLIQFCQFLMVSCLRLFTYPF